MVIEETYTPGPMKEMARDNEQLMMTWANERITMIKDGKTLATTVQM